MTSNSADCAVYSISEINVIFEKMVSYKTGRDFSVMLLTENELIGSFAEADA